MQLRQEAADRVRLLIAGRDVLFQRHRGASAKIVIRQVRAGGADDAGFGLHLAVAKAVIQCRQQFPECQVAGGAEDDAVENSDGYDLRHP